MTMIPCYTCVTLLHETHHMHHIQSSSYHNCCIIDYMKINGIDVKVMDKYGARFPYVPVLPSTPIAQVFVILSTYFPSGFKYVGVKVPKGMPVSDIGRFKEYCFNRLKLMYAPACNHFTTAKLTDLFMVMKPGHYHEPLKTLPERIYFT